jgi:hypothetical protein
MARGSPAVEWMGDLAERAGEDARRIGATSMLLLFDPARHIATVAADPFWSFPVVAVVGYAAAAAVLLRLAWSALTRALGLEQVLAGAHPRVLVVFGALLCFLVVLAGATHVAIWIAARRRVRLILAMNCVAIALVPLSAFTLAAWVAAFLFPGAAFLLLLFGTLVSLFYFAEALHEQYEPALAFFLYGVPMVIVAALVATVLFLLAVGSSRS